LGAEAILEEGNQAKLRKLLRAHYEEHDRIQAEWKARSYSYPPPKTVPFSEECRGMECGAKTRAGTPCKRRDLFRKGRCKLHGGMSTGPRSEAGKKRSSMNAKTRTP